MVVYGGSMVVYGGSMGVYGGSMVIYGGLWWSMVVCGGLWWIDGSSNFNFLYLNLFYDGISCGGVVGVSTVPPSHCPTVVLWWTSGGSVVVYGGSMVALWLSMVDLWWSMVVLWWSMVDL